jgi:AMMECR1 domain-containing protein
VGLPAPLLCLCLLPVQVSLLSCFETAANWKDWEIGKHGIIIECVLG